MDPVSAESVREALRQSIDWDFVIEQAEKHGVIPLLSWNLSRFELDGFSKATFNRLKNEFAAIARRNLFLTAELIKLLNLFRENEIRALPLKGPVLAATAYGNVSLRHFGDLDILISSDDFLAAKDLLRQQGYQSKFSLNTSEEIKYLRSHHDYPLCRISDGVVVDLQWGITQWSFAFPFDFDEMWEHREICSLAGSSVFNLPSETLLLLLCVHGTKHEWERLTWICDLAELVKTDGENINWPRLVEQARARGGERMLQLGLFLAQDLLGARVPKIVADRILKHSSVEGLADKVSGRIFRHTSCTDRLLRDDRPLFFWEVRERLRDKLIIAWRYFPDYFLMMVTPNEKDRAILQLPRFLSMGYYLVRPVRLVLERCTKFGHHFDLIEK